MRISSIVFFFFQAEDGIRDLVRSRGLGDVYKRQDWYPWGDAAFARARDENKPIFLSIGYSTCHWCHVCLLYTSDAADERSSVDLGGRRIIKKKTTSAVRVYRSLLSISSGYREAAVDSRQYEQNNSTHQ